MASEPKESFVCLAVASTPEQLAAPDPAPGWGLDAQVCPRCGGEVFGGYGLGVGGGVGHYVLCVAEPKNGAEVCGWAYEKHENPEDE